MATSTVLPISVVTLEVAGIVSSCKDILTAEWAVFKKTNELQVKRVCTYSVGGPRDNPVGTLDSVASCSVQWDLLLRDIVDSKVGVVTHTISKGIGYPVAIRSLFNILLYSRIMDNIMNLT